MKKNRSSYVMYFTLGLLFVIAVFLTVEKFNGIEEQYKSMEPNLDNYSTAEILFLAFERSRIAVYHVDQPADFEIKKSIFDSKLNILKNKSQTVNSFYYGNDFLNILNTLQTQNAELDQLYAAQAPGNARLAAVLKKMDEIQPTLIDLQEIIYRIQIEKFNKITEIIHDNSSCTELAALASIFLLFALVSLLWRHITKLKTTINDKNIFISAIYHELSASIQKIQISRDMIDIRGELASAENYLNNIAFHSDKLYQQTRDILEFSKIEIGNVDLTLSNFKLPDLLDEVLHHFAEKNGNRLITRISSTDILIKTDKQKMTSVINNLVDNANKNTVNGDIHLSLKLYGNRVFIKVCDTGCGFDLKKLNLLYQPFNQGVKSETRQGLGLGLTIVKSHLKTLNARIKVKSTIDVGSSFFVSIPVIKLDILR